MCQRDQTPNLADLENIAFQDTRFVFLNTAHIIFTLEDDLFRKRASDSQVKSLSARKAEGEGHSVDAVAQDPARMVLGLWFYRRGERYIDSIEALFASLLEEREENIMRNCIVTADRV